MAEFTKIKEKAVRPEEEISIENDTVSHSNSFIIFCEWLEYKGCKQKTRYWVYTNMSEAEAFHQWRSETWEELFDPFKVKILELNISARCGE